MIKRIMFTTTIIINICSQLCSMELASQDNLNLFTIHTNDASHNQVKNLNLQFRHIDLNNLIDPQNDQEQKDQKSFMNVLCDFDANTQAYGPEVAQYLADIPSATVLTTWIGGQNNKLVKMPDNQKIMYHWIIEDIDNDRAFVGRMCVHTYVGQRPDNYADTFMLAFGLTIDSKYRNQKVFSRIAQQTLLLIEVGQDFQGALFCFDTDTDNIPMHQVAQKIGAQKVHSWAREINVDSSKTMTRQSDLFVIPKEKQ